MIMENQLVELANEYLNTDVYLERYQKVDLYVYDQAIIKGIVNSCKFKDVGNVYDYPEILTQPTEMNIYQLTANYDMLHRIAVSEKFNAIMYYTSEGYSIKCAILIEIDKLKKFAKKVKNIISKDSGANIFKDVDFESGKGKYIEITNPSDDKTKLVDIIQNTVNEENLVFDPESVINEVMDDINIFFSDKTLELYNKLEIPYKRGIILYGDPGNGKSAMIRELIRSMDGVVKVIINPGIHNVTAVLASLVKALNGKKAIIVIEDFDSVINERNRSEFLNILDGVSVISGIFFIGTTNYPDKIDPAFMNRSGRFDRTYEIKNPSENTRRLYFKSRKLGKLLSYYKTYKDDNKPDSNDGVIELFVQHSDGVPMANLKELITSTSYLLASNDNMSIEEAITKCHENISATRDQHVQSYQSSEQQRMVHPYPGQLARLGRY